MIELKYIYCYWCWIISFLFYFNIIKYSPLISLFIGFLYTFFSNLFYYKTHYTKKIVIILWELLILLIIFNKSRQLDFIFNITIFLIYLTYLKINNLSFKKVYFTEIPKIHNNKDNVFQYIIKKLTN